LHGAIAHAADRATGEVKSVHGGGYWHRALLDDWWAPVWSRLRC